MIELFGSKKGFNLIELMIVCVIIAVLVTIFAPLYTRSYEQSIGAKAYENLNLIRSAQGVYRTDAPIYCNNVPLLQTFTPFSTDDGDWTYILVPTPSGTAFTARAIRKSGEFTGFIIDIDQKGEVAYTSPFTKYPP